MLATDHVNIAINLDNQPHFVAVEIGEVGTEDVLATKLESGLLAAELLPEDQFRDRHLPAKFAGTLARLFRLSRRSRRDTIGPASLRVSKSWLPRLRHGDILTEKQRRRKGFLPEGRGGEAQRAGGGYLFYLLLHIPPAKNKYSLSRSCTAWEFGGDRVEKGKWKK